MISKKGYLFTLFLLASCGGGGGGGSPSAPSTPAPLVTFSSSVSEILLGNPVSLTWSSSNATSCTASGAWSGSKGTSGSEDITLDTPGSNTLTLACSGSGGSTTRSVTVTVYRNFEGKVVDGYISGARVFIDANDNYLLDENETSESTGVDGAFTLRYANGSLVSIGGSDADTQNQLDNLLLMHKMAGYTDLKIVSPVTTVAAFMEDPTQVNAALGLDATLDVFSVDPVANKGDGGVYDQLYEAGNKLTVLALSLQGITNNLNSSSETTQDYFKAITEEIAKEYAVTGTKVAIDTAGFVTKTLDNVIAAKTVTLSDSAKENTITALSSTMQLIQVKSDAAVTSSIISFATSNLLTDIVSIANGTASEELINNYTSDLINYVATTENIDANEITPDITALPDSVTTLEDVAVTIFVVSNDSIITSSPFSITASNPANGSIAIGKDHIIYTPLKDFNGLDSFTYTISQGGKSSTAKVSITVEAVNDAPSINTSSTFIVPEGQLLVTTIDISDLDGDTLTLTLGGTDQSSFNLSADYQLSFKEAPIYDNKNSYSILLTVSDGTDSSNKALTIKIIRTFTGNAIDGYLSGAKVFVDQNFNFNFDEGELSATTGDKGSFSMSVSDTLYACLLNRPVVVDVPVGAIDSKRGEVTKAFKMIMPSVNDTGIKSIIISPFTNLLSNAISKAKADVEIVEDLTLAEGCGTKGDSIATKISAEVKQLTDSIESSIGISYKNLLTDFVESSPNALITETAAESLADYLPYFKIATDEIDKELSEKYGIDINTNLTIQRETVQNILANSPDTIELNFFTVYKDKPNALGWFLQDSVEARKGILNRNGELVHAECIGGVSANCKTTNFSLEAIKNASNWYMKRSDLINESYKLNDDNWTLNYEESMYVTYNPDGSVNQRRCNDQNWLYLQPKFQEENRVRNDRYNTGYAYGGSGFDSCAIARSTGITEVNQVNPSIPSNALFLALVETWTNPQNQTKEEFDIRLTNSNFASSKFLVQKLDNIFEKRANLNIDPLVQEIKGIPRSLEGIDSIRAKVIPGSGDQLTIYFTKRNESNQQTNSYNLSVGELRSNDTFQEYSYTNSASGSSSQKINEVSGFNALTSFRTALIDNSGGFSDTKYSGTINTLKGKAIDGYIAGAEIFIDKNFNFIKDADEYSTTTGSDGSFVLDIFGSAYACLLERPIVANVPVGAVDSTLGTVTSAYRMILPSIKDSGASKVFITPFTSILSDAILKGKQEAGIKDELSSQEACATKGNQVATKISAEILKIKTLIQDTYGVTYETVLGDFIENGASGVVSEVTAQNIAKFLRPLKSLQDNISTSMTASLNIPITANISLDKSVVDTIFAGNSLTEIPLNFYSVYTTEPNNLGWRREVSFKADGAKVLSDGTIKAYKCLNNPSSDCVSNNLSLDKLSIFSNSYRQTVGFYYGLGTGDQVTIGNASGLLAVDASDVKYFFVSEGQDRFACSTEEQIQLRGNAVNNISWEYKYQTNYNEYNTDLNGCRNSQVSNVVPARRGSLEILRKDSVSNIDVATTYVIPNMDNTSLFSTTPKKLIENFETVDPKAILTEIATLPDNYYQADYAKGLLGASEEIQYYWAERYPSGDYKTQYILKVYPATRSDGKTYELTVSNYADGNTTPSSSSTSSGNDALTNFNTHLSSLTDAVTSAFYTNPLVLVADSITLAEDSVLAFNPLANDTIPDGASITLTASTPTNGSVSINGNTITYTPRANFFGQDTFTYTVVSNNTKVSASVSVDVSSVNDLPNINNTATSYSFNENATAAVLTVDASDVEGETLSYTVSGSDAAKFNISSAGVLTFSASPDYENPQDSDANNTYELNLVVSDGGGSTTKAINVTVINVPDLVSGVAVDGYVAGATVFQDLNNDGDLDAGEPNTSTNALGQFSLTLTSVATNAPVRILNGYDLATNEVLPSILDISATETGSYVVTPISTLIGRLRVSDSNLSTSIAESVTASALGIDLSAAPNGTVLGFDPLAYFNGNDVDLASKARPVFANNQLLMAMGGVNYSIYKYVVDASLSALSTSLTTAAGQSITLSSADDILAIKQKAYDAVFDSHVDTMLAWNPPINNMQFKSNKAVLTDYLDGSSSNAVAYSLFGEYLSGKFKADLVGAKLDYENLKAIVTNQGSGNPMDLSFELSNLPTGSGSTPVTLRMFHGSDTSQAADEDYFEISLTANWSSNGSLMSITLPDNATITGKFYDRGGTVLTKTYTNQAADVFTVDQQGPNRPASLSIRISRLFDLFPLERAQLQTFLDAKDTFTYQVVLGSFPIYDHEGNSFSEIYGSFSVNSNPSNVLFADDIFVNENAASKSISFYQSKVQTQDVSVQYAISSSSTAGSADYTLTNGTVTIPAGSMSATLTVPVINDDVFESTEKLVLELSNPSGAVLGRTATTVHITDGEKILANSSQKAVLVNNIYKHSRKFIVDYLKNTLDTETVTVGGSSTTLSQLMVTGGVTTDVYGYLDNIAASYEVASEAVISAALTKADGYITSQLSGFASYQGFATALTQIISGIKAMNIGNILGTYINSDGTFPDGQSATTLATATAAQIDTLITLAADTVADVLGSDTSSNFPNANVIIGTDGNDTLTGTAGSDLIATFNGTDTVNAGGGNDKVLGGADVDTLNGEAGNDHLYGYAGNDVLSGGDGNDKILGGLGNDTIRGGAGDDDLRGESGDDTIYSGAGTDTINGGLGNDTIYIDGM